jgi:amino acid transporter
MNYAVRMDLPTPAYTNNVPILTKSGGQGDAYKDPKSPESTIMDLAVLQAQASVDSKYDIKTSAFHEGTEAFANYESVTNKQILLVIITFIFILLVTIKSLRIYGKLFLLTVAVVLMILVIGVYSRDER